MFEQQVNTDAYVTNIVYAIGIVSVMLAVTGMTMLDIGLVRKKNAIDTAVQKIGAGMACALGFLPIGYAIWVWQYYQALGVPSPLKQAIDDWWLGGTLLNAIPQSIDPKIFPGVDTFQVFFVFFVAFAIFMGAVIHTVGVERMKPLPLYALSFVAGAVILPVLTYLMWGSVGPLSNRGVHDHVGGIAIYVALGAMALVLAWRIGPRIGTFGPNRGPDRPGPTNIPFVALGVVLVLAALPFFALGGAFIIPGSGFYGISMSTSGFGKALINLFAAVIGGGIGGLALSYRLRDPYWAIAGPFVGYVAGTTIYDVGRPWYLLLIGLGAPVAGLVAARAMHRLRIDEEKVVPLVLGPAVYGAIIGGFAAWHTKIGGYFGIESGKYAFQHAEVTPWWQLIGVVVAVVIAGGITLVVCLVFERLGGLRVSEDEEVAGLDALYWPEEEDDVLGPKAGSEPTGVPALHGGA